MSESNGNGHEKLREVDDAAPAIQIRVASQAGSRAIEMTFMAPLAMKLSDLNAYVDKVVSVSDRLQAKGELMRAKADLEGAVKALRTSEEQQEAYLAKCALEWQISGRKGGWRPQGAQQAQLDNWKKTIVELHDKRIPAFKAEIAKLEAEIQQGL